MTPYRIDSGASEMKILLEGIDFFKVWIKLTNKLIWITGWLKMDCLLQSTHHWNEKCVQEFRWEVVSSSDANSTALNSNPSKNWDLLRITKKEIR